MARPRWGRPRHNSVLCGDESYYKNFTSESQGNNKTPEKNQGFHAVMLDWIDRILTPCPRFLRDMGYLRELLNIRTCYQWWESAWQPHLQRSRDIIRAAIARCPRRRKAVILGSGLLYDVPVPELADAFAEVVLVDLLHPFRTRRQLRRFGNVKTLTADVSGVVEPVHRIAGDPAAPLPRATPQLFLNDPDVDLVASVNLLSQLPCMPVGYLRRMGVHSKESIDAFAHDVCQAHVDYLRQLPGVVALIADYEALTLNRNGDLLKQTSTTYGVDIPWRGEEWVWRLIPLARRPPYHSEWLKVRGIVDVKDASR